jgi:hypothetical protein
MMAKLPLPTATQPDAQLTMYAVAQRRGPAVHTFITTCGSFLEEVPARFPRITRVEDAPWTTPKILNTITKAQPMIDAFNRVLIDQLGMHDAFITRCCETRFVQHFLFPITYINALNASQYFNPVVYPKEMRPKALLLKLAFHMVHNHDWLSVNNFPKAGPGTGASVVCSNLNKRSYKQEQGFNKVSINGGPPSRESPCKHILIPLTQVEGYKGHRQRRCFECNMPCSWACARCSDGRTILALHPSVTQGSKRRFGCLAAHRANPGGGGYKETHEQITGTAVKSSRRRRIEVDFV